MKTLITSLQGISREPTLRYDYDYYEYKNETAGTCYMFSDLFEINTSSAISEEDLHVDFNYCEIGNVDKDGDVNPEQLNFENRNLLTENYYKKIEEGDIISVKKDDILLSKVRPNLKKFVRITPDIEGFYYTSAFISLRPKTLPVILYYALRTLFCQDLIAISRQGKGYPTISISDLRFMQFDKALIDTLTAKSEGLTRRIIAVEDQIKNLKVTLRPASDIINVTFEREFRLDSKAILETSQSKTASTDLHQLTFNNSNLRFSSRWNKAGTIQKEILEMSNDFQPLGRYIVDTKNGYSPECSEIENETAVLGIDAIQKDAILRFDNLKFTDSPIPNAETYTVNNDDFFVSRGNTTDLVALASVAHIDDEMMPMIFPDLMIKITFTPLINRTFMAYVFNSFIGRLYFKYATKGKNQTMVKVSAKELNDFYVPIISSQEQQRIVDEIQDELDRQATIRDEIAGLRKQIEEMIEAAVSAD